MYRAPSKRSQVIKRAAVYVSMTLAVGVLVSFLVFVMLGYRFNRDTSTIEQGGLVQFATRPIDANVTIGNAKLSDQTPSKITVNPGKYAVTMTKPGYLPWAKNADVRSGQVLWLNYAQLVPEKISTREVLKIGTISSLKASPNGDHLAVIKDATKPVITFVDVSGDSLKQVDVTVPTGSLPKDKKLVFSLGAWAADSDRLLVNVTYEKTTVRLLVDRRDGNKTVNVSSLYEKDISEILFDPRSSERLIIRTSKGDVRIVDTSNNSLSKLLASSVTSMSLYGNDAIVLVQNQLGGGQSIGYVSFGSAKVRVIKRVDSKERTLAGVASYFSEPYFVMSVGNRLELYKLRSLPSSESDSSISMTSLYATTLPAPAQFVSIRSSGRFAFVQYGSGVLTYDIELSKQFLTSFTSQVNSEIRWLDKYHFYITSGSQLEVLEFDGGNARKITPLATQLDAVLSDDGKYIYSVNSKAGKTFVIQRSQMILE